MFHCQHRAAQSLRKNCRAIPGIAAGLIVATAAAAAPFPAEVELSELLPTSGGDGSLGTILEGIAASDRSGISVAGAGDINGDGAADMVVGAFQASPGGLFLAGESYVVFGSASGLGAEFELSSLASGDGSQGFVLPGITPGDFSGENVAGGADLNADGIDDVVIGANLADGNGLGESGQVFVIYGSLSGFPASIDPASLLATNGGDGSVGSVVQGAAVGDFAGEVAVGGDFNGDGVDDLLIGASRADPAGRVRAGETYVVFGRVGGLGAEFELASLKSVNGGDGSEGVVLQGLDAFDSSGTSVDTAGDVNGDNIDDLIIGAPDASALGLPDAGEVYLVLGRSDFPAEVALSSLLPANGGDGSTGTILYGEAASAKTGRSVSGGGDLDDDGLADVVVGASLLGAGRSYVYFGRATLPATVLLSSLASVRGGDGSDGFILEGEFSGDLAGRVVGDLGDVNADGLDDVAVGAFLASPGDRVLAGSTYVIYGRSSAFPAEIALASLRVAGGGDGSVGFVVNGIDPNDGSGADVGAAGDVNDDGIADLIIGADTADPNGVDSAGESYVLFGRAAAVDPDSDGDGIPDTADNCTEVPNPGQEDTNGDGFGNICDADFNDDNTINFLDLNAMKVQFFSTPASPGWDPDFDLNSDDAVNFFDLNLMKGSFFGMPGPSGIAP